MFRIEWLIGAATRKGSSYWPLRQNIFFPFKQLEADSGCLYHPDGPHRNKLQMAPRERIARAAHRTDDSYWGTQNPKDL
jgi:hypothetical protein